MQLAEVGSWTSFPSVLGDHLPGVVTTGPCKAAETTQVQRTGENPSS